MTRGKVNNQSKSYANKKNDEKCPHHIACRIFFQQLGEPELKRLGFM